MDSAKQERQQELFEDEVVVDADVHATYFHPDIQQDIADQMSEPYRSYLTSALGDSSAFGGTPLQHSGWPKTLGGKKETIVNKVTSGADVQEKVCDELGVTHPIVNMIAQPDRITKTDRALEETRAANNVLINRFLDDYEDFYGLASVAAREPDKAAEEIDRIGDEDQIVGFFIMAGAEYQRPLGDPQYDIMYQAAEDNGLTPVFHLSMIDRNFPMLRDLEKFVSDLTLTPLGLMITLVSLVYQGVPEKFPDLDFVFLEGGLSWIPYFMGRMNKYHSGWRTELPMLEKTPEEYIRDSFYFGTQPHGEFNNPSHFVEMMNIVGMENIMFTSDHPHHDFDNLATVDGFFKQFSEEEREMALRGNAIDAFNLPISHD